MNTSTKVRKIAREIVVAYAHHVKDRVRMNDTDYVQLGLDEDFEVYASLFKVVISEVLNVTITVDVVYSKALISELKEVLLSSILLRGYKKVLENDAYAFCVYEVCLHVLKKVKEEEFSDNLAYYH